LEKLEISSYLKDTSNDIITSELVLMINAAMPTIEKGFSSEKDHQHRGAHRAMAIRKS
jgi:hypothetical protein